MSNVAIRVENVSKKFRIGRQQPYHRFSEVLHGLAHKAVTAPARWVTRREQNRDEQVESDEFWALRDVSFDVKQGEVVGIIGRNGAGKSTLLKILSRITEPTSGRFGVRGRIGSLLEVGTGFHPELTGRENIYLNGAILGMSRREIDCKFDEIVAFAEIEQFLDTPVKHYSSGMYVRLGFAIAAHLEPEILIIDEVLAVGDASFQKKCLGKMSDVAHDGRTVLFVSHNLVAVRGLCQRVLVLEGGRLILTGSPAEAVTHYRRIGGSGEFNSRKWQITEAPGNNDGRLLQISVAPFRGATIDVQSGVRISLDWFNSLECGNIDCTLRLVNADDVLVFQRGTVVADAFDSRRGVYRISTIVPPNLLNNDRYRLSILFGRDRTYLLTRVDDVVEFEVENSAQRGKWSAPPGVIRPEFEWESSFCGRVAEISGCR